MVDGVEKERAGLAHESCVIALPVCMDMFIGSVDEDALCLQTPSNPLSVQTPR
jgi:hypothetical protein